RGIAPHLGTGSDGEISLVRSIDENEADVVLDLDLVLLAALEVSDEPDQAGVALGPRLERARAQAPGKARGQHGDAGLLDDLPDAGDVGWAVILAAHVEPTSARRRGSPRRRARASGRRVANRLDIVAVGIEHEGAVVVRMIVRPHPRRAVVLAA